MKLAPLLARYLYTNHRLELPGLGIFSMDGQLMPAPDPKTKTTIAPPVNFENKPSVRDAGGLVQFISTETGKIKALAAADLESYLELAQQFLNIGKPFLFEGIGSLVKTRSGEFVFTSGQAMPEVMGEVSQRELSSTASSEENYTDYNRVFNPPPKKIEWQKPAAALFLFAGIAFAVWAGYRISQKKKAPVTIAEPDKSYSDEVTPKITPVVTNDTSLSSNTASAMSSPAQNVISSEPAQVKFILEQMTSKRAFARYNQLKNLNWPVQLETKDSLQYTLYMKLPVSLTDTSHIADSLTRMNGRRVHVE